MFTVLRRNWAVKHLSHKLITILTYSDFCDLTLTLKFSYYTTYTHIIIAWCQTRCDWSSSWRTGLRCTRRARWGTNGPLGEQPGRPSWTNICRWWRCVADTGRPRGWPTMTNCAVWWESVTTEFFNPRRHRPFQALTWPLRSGQVPKNAENRDRW